MGNYIPATPTIVWPSCNSRCAAESMQTHDAAALFGLQIVSMDAVIVDDKSTTTYAWVLTVQTPIARRDRRDLRYRE